MKKKFEGSETKGETPVTVTVTAFIYTTKGPVADNARFERMWLAHHEVWRQTTGQLLDFAVH